MVHFLSIIPGIMPMSSGWYRGAQALFHVPLVLGVLMVLALEGLIGFAGYEVIHQPEKWGSAILTVLFAVLSLRILQHGNIPCMTRSTMERRRAPLS
jgi:purine-cytosine permease-like protein